MLTVQVKPLKRSTMPATGCARVFEQCSEVLEQGKLPALLGGDHSTPLGLMQALSLKYPSFGILQIDAHADLRKAYEGFTLFTCKYHVQCAADRTGKGLVQVGSAMFVRKKWT